MANVANADEAKKSSKSLRFEDKCFTNCIMQNRFQN